MRRRTTTRTDKMDLEYTLIDCATGLIYGPYEDISPCASAPKASNDGKSSIAWVILSIGAPHHRPANKVLVENQDRRQGLCHSSRRTASLAGLFDFNHVFDGQAPVRGRSIRGRSHVRDRVRLAQLTHAGGGQLEE